MIRMAIPIRLRWRGWLTRERLEQLANSRQGFTARLAEGKPSDVTFSVVLSFAATARAANATTRARLELLAPDRLPDVAATLTVGRRLTIFSGSRVVAEGEILPVPKKRATRGSVQISPRSESDRHA